MKTFFTKLVGVTFEGRQRIIRSLTIGQELYFRREPNNPYDSNCVNVVTSGGLSVGYIAKDKNSQLAADLDAGKRYVVHVSSITGGGFDCAYGVNIQVDY
jgi:single-stranded-DNA-specific exonuclease